MTIPALTRNYWARGNQTFPNNTSIANVCKSFLFCLVQSLLDTSATGSASGSRVAGSIWTCLGSCDGTTAALDTVNRWASIANIIQANDGSAHSWIVLRNSALGYDLLIDCNSGTNNALRLSFTPSTSAFSGGGTTHGPTSAGEEFLAGNNIASPAASSNAICIGDTTILQTNYAHFVTADNGEFLFFTGRAGANCFTTLFGFWKLTSGEAGDSRTGVSLLGQSGVSSRGTPVISVINSVSFSTQRLPNGSVIATGGVGINQYGGATYSSTGGVSALTSNYLIDQIKIRAITNQVVDRGILPDLYLAGTVPVGSGYPATGASQTHIVVGDMLVPCPGVSVLI